MAEADGDLVYEILKNIQQRLENTLGGVKHEIVAMRLQALSTQTDINNIYSVNARIDQRLDRIDRRLELRELAEAQKAFDPDA